MMARSGVAERGQAADPALVARWVRGWAISRGVHPPVSDHGAHRVEVGLPEQRRRYVFAGLSPEVKPLARGIHEPWVFLKICAPAAEVRALLPPRWTLQARAFMMTCPVDAPVAATLPPGYRLACAGTPPWLTATILAEDGASAASGGLALVQDHAVFDRIVTDETHRRLGLGRAIMVTLARLAHENGARRGVLVATPMGRDLYSGLGWSVHAPYTSALILPG